jgi:hypothetical protein
MINIPTAIEIISTYRKHGWVLRRILLRDPNLGTVLAASADIGGLPILPSPINAAWFSRPPKDGPVAWEIRYLGNTPFALVETLEENDPDFEYVLSRTEARLGETIAVKEAS